MCSICHRVSDARSCGGHVDFSTLLIVFVLAINKVPRLLAVYLTFISIINAISACFFILTPLDFPYTIADFCMLYIGTEVGLWLLIPVILSIALYAMPASLTSKFLFIVFKSCLLDYFRNGALSGVSVSDARLLRDLDVLVLLCVRTVVRLRVPGWLLYLVCQ
jgi:hypothetical protein